MKVKLSILEYGAVFRNMDETDIYLFLGYAWVYLFPEKAKYKDIMKVCGILLYCIAKKSENPLQHAWLTYC